VSPFRAFPFLANFPGPNFLRGIQIRWDGGGSVEGKEAQRQDTVRKLGTATVAYARLSSWLLLYSEKESHGTIWCTALFGSNKGNRAHVSGRGCGSEQSKRADHGLRLLRGRSRTLTGAHATKRQSARRSPVHAMSSERSPASAMDANAEPAPPSPRSKKRASRTGDCNSSPNPSPGASPAGRSDPKLRRLRTSAESAALALASVAAHASAASVDEDAGRGPAGVRVDEGHGAIQMLGAAAARVDRDRATGQKHGNAYASRGASQKHWSEADELTLLNAALDFRKRTGRVPRLPDMPEFFESVTGSISPEIDQWTVYYKLKRLKSKFQHTDGPSDRRLRNLCASLWGFVLPYDISDGETNFDERRAAPDSAAMMPVVAEVLGEYWRTNARAMELVPLEKGLSRLSKKQGRLMETKWRQQLDEEMQTQMRRHDLAKEVCSLLNGAIKDLGP
jgi:hypothetical protein